MLIICFAPQRYAIFWYLVSYSTNNLSYISIKTLQSHLLLTHISSLYMLTYLLTYNKKIVV